MKNELEDIQTQINKIIYDKVRIYNELELLHKEMHPENVNILEVTNQEIETILSSKVVTVDKLDKLIEDIDDAVKEIEWICHHLKSMNKDNVDEKNDDCSSTDSIDNEGLENNIYFIIELINNNDIDKLIYMINDQRNRLIEIKGKLK